MDSSLRKNIADRDATLDKTARVTRRIAAVSAAGSLVLMAGFAHLIPTGFSHSSQSGGGGGTSSGGSGGGSGTGSGNSGDNNGTHGTPSPSRGSSPSHATSGGS